MSRTMRWDIGFPQEKAEWKVIAESGPRMLGTSRYIFCLIPAGDYFIPGEEAGMNKAKIITLVGGPCVSLIQAILHGIIHFCIPELVQPGSGLYEILLSVSAFLNMQYAVAGIVCLFLMLYGMQYSMTDQYRRISEHSTMKEAFILSIFPLFSCRQIHLRMDCLQYSFLYMLLRFEVIQENCCILFLHPCQQV